MVVLVFDKSSERRSTSSHGRDADRSIVTSAASAVSAEAEEHGRRSGAVHRGDPAMGCGLGASAPCGDPARDCSHEKSFGDPSCLPAIRIETLEIDCSSPIIGCSSVSTDAGTSSASAAAGSEITPASSTSAAAGSEITPERQLIAEAAKGAEKQAACRDTMLSLKDAFESALRMQAHSDALRLQAEQRLAELEARGDGGAGKRLRETQAKVARLEAELRESEQREEEEKLEKWKARLLNNKGNFNFVMMLSRDAHPLGCLSNDEDAGLATAADNDTPMGLDLSRDGGDATPKASFAADPHTAGSSPLHVDRGTQLKTNAKGDNSSGNGPAQVADSSNSVSQQPRHATSATSVKAKSPSSGRAQKTLSFGPSSREAQRDAVSQQDGAAGSSSDGAGGSSSDGAPNASSSSTQVANPAATSVGGRSVGDNLTLSWVLKLWAHRIRSKDHKRSADKAVAVAPLVVDCQCGTEGDPLKDEILDLKHDLQQAEKLRMQAEQERDNVWQQLADVAQRHENEKQQLADELSWVRRDTQIQLAQKSSEMEKLQKQIADQQDSMNRAQAAWENEKRAMKATIRDITSELQQAVTQARRMELMAQRMKGNSNSDLKDKISQLIADLEAARNRLASTAKERDQALDNNDALNRRLGITQRKMELERQFLPLIHLARGPVGQSNTTLNRTSKSSKSDPMMTTVGQSEMLH